MATVVAVMDRDGWHENTDIIVVVDPEDKLLLWVPRDLWCRQLGATVNAAFAAAGHRQLLDALAELGVAAEHCICLQRKALERGLAGMSVTVPVAATLRFWYPLSPTTAIEKGRKKIHFRPPTEVLTGERIHQWLGARYLIDVDGERSRPLGIPRLPDLHRIHRQQVFLACALRQRPDASTFVSDPALVSISDPRACEEVAQVDASWSFRTVDDVVPARIRGSEVLLRSRNRQGD
jgi:hypothetical protein